MVTALSSGDNAAYAATIEDDQMVSIAGGN